MMIANLGVDVIDCGVPVLSMHAPFEVASKVDYTIPTRPTRRF
jgi:aspartyl aminopeptidase